MKNTWSSVAKVAVEALRKIQAGANMPQVFEALRARAAEENKHLSARGPASTLWAMAKTGPDMPGVIEALCAKAAEEMKGSQCEKACPRRTSTGRTCPCARAVAKTGANMPDGFEALSCKLVEKSEDFNARELTSTLLDMAKTGGGLTDAFESLCAKDLTDVAEREPAGAGFHRVAGPHRGALPVGAWLVALCTAVAASGPSGLAPAGGHRTPR